MSNKFCTACGALLEPGVSFCGQCGQSVEPAKSSTESVPPQNSAFSSYGDTSPKNSNSSRNVIGIIVLLGLIGIWYFVIRTPSDSEVCKHLGSIMESDPAKIEEGMPRCLEAMKDISKELSPSDFKGLKKCVMRAKTPNDRNECGERYGLR